MKLLPWMSVLPALLLTASTRAAPPRFLVTFPSARSAQALDGLRRAGLLEERDRIIQIEKDARAQLASDLHDGPTQGVAAITMRLNYVRKLIERKILPPANA